MRRKLFTEEQVIGVLNEAGGADSHFKQRFQHRR